MNEIPTLTLDPFGDEAKPEEILAKVEESVEKEIVLSEAEQKIVDDFAEQINITDSNTILQFGAGAQKKIADFSETALGQVRTKDLGEVGEMLSGVVQELRNFEQDGEEEKGFKKLFKRPAQKIADMKTKYAKAESNVNRITTTLENHQVTLLKDVAMLDKMYELNKTYFKELNMYIMAGKKKLDFAQNKEIPALIEKSRQSGLPEDAQAVNDMKNMINRFEKKLYDLELTKTISLQMAPQIRLIQENDSIMAEKIQSTIVNTIPLWKSQMVLALGVTHAGQAAEAQREVSKMTNELLKKNAETLKTATIEVAKESERGIVEIETLKHTNESLITTLDEVLKIQEEGHQRRRDAEIELNRIETELKEKLLSIRK